MVSTTKKMMPLAVRRPKILEISVPVTVYVSVDNGVTCFGFPAPRELSQV